MGGGTKGEGPMIGPGGGGPGSNTDGVAFNATKPLFEFMASREICEISNPIVASSPLMIL